MSPPNEERPTRPDERPAVYRERAAKAALALPHKRHAGLPAGRIPLERPPAFREAKCGGPERKLRGRPPSPVEPCSGPWRRTGSESGAGRARTRHQLEYDASLGMTTTRRES